VVPAPQLEGDTRLFHIPGLDVDRRRAVKIRISNVLAVSFPVVSWFQGFLAG